MTKMALYLGFATSIFYRRNVHYIFYYIAACMLRVVCVNIQVNADLYIGLVGDIVICTLVNVGGLIQIYTAYC